VTITQQAVFNGVIIGLTYAITAAAIVLVYRSTGVLNFALGAMGTFGVAVFALFNAGYGIPYPIAFLMAVAISALIGMVIELTVVRRLFTSPRLVLLIATIGVAQLLNVCRVSLPDAAAGSTFPLPFEFSWQPTSEIVVSSRELIVLIVAPITIAALAIFMTKTKFGLMVRASASNPDTARLFGISVKRTSTIVWTLSGVLAAITAIMIAPLQGATPGSLVQSGGAAIGVSLLVRGLVVALIARMNSLPMTLVGGLAVGIAESLIRTNVDPRNQSVVDVWLFIATLALVLFWVRARGDRASQSLTARVKPIPERLKSIWYVRHLSQMGFAALFGFLALIPLIFSQASQQLVWTDVLIFAMVAVPISMLTGWAGQFSFGQFAFVGLGAVVMVMLTHGLDVPVPFDLWDMSFHLPWGAAAFVATMVGMTAALLIGLPALRVRGMFLAVVTLAFAVAASSWLFTQSAFTGSEFSTVTPFMQPPKLVGIDFSDGRSFYYLCLFCLAVMTAVMAQVRRTGLGRSMIAVSDNEDAASASTVSAERVKLVAFTLACGMAAFAGCLFITLRVQINTSSTFAPDESLQLMATAVIGGLGSVAGGILGALFVRGLPALFGYGGEVQLLTSSIGLLLLLMYFPGGLMQIVYSFRSVVLRRAERQVEAEAEAKVEVEVEAAPLPAPASGTLVPRHADRQVEVPADDTPWLSLRDVGVRFGGIQAVNGVTLDVAGGELIGLIGANGAGKSTLMNAISGFVSSTGRIEVLGHDVGRLPAYRRHQVGLGRGFQTARLYPSLTLRETIMVALEARERSYVVPSISGLPRSRASERRKRSDADDLIDLLGLGLFSNQFIADLSTGTRRIVELGCLLAVEAKVLMLDEPTAGVAQRETEAFGPLIVRIRRELGAAMVLIEHDMPLVMSISDRVYCMEAGEIIAEGAPEDVRCNPQVIASYLGTDERAIQRSNAPSPLADAIPSSGPNE
jgi:ABC-type branched-subunit amino acid transport system ATPase component/ABC-type branched-subunit amino acid transport system permease subunit